MITAIGTTRGVPARSARNVLDGALGVDRRALCEAAGVELAALDDEASLPFQRLVQLYELAARWTGDPEFGLHVGERIDPRAFDLIGYLAVHSATVGEAFERLARYLALWTTSAQLTWERERTSARLTWRYLEGGITAARQDTEMTMLTVSRVGWLASTPARAREVRFRHARPHDVREHARLFAAPVHFGQADNELIYSHDALAAPLPGSDPRLCRLLIEYAERLLASRPRTPSPVEQARAILEHAIVDVATLARRMGTSARSLQRLLLAHGTSYRALVDEVRRELATRLLRERELSIAEIADRLGYRQSSELHRAFRGWTGTTPQQYRARSQ